ncbi:MAG: type IV toxin-antitoxin system AbiEi family antitoxin domain-containing protein [Myxococcales bacterium]|nr:type IV toxin-antitoxin system AbiEi family antitoxin domain-containing protein [Myxococcales bacterium]
MVPTQEKPRWRALRALAERQGGMFTTGQARALGVSPTDLRRRVRQGKLLAWMRGIYQWAGVFHGRDWYFVYWLWSGRKAVFSHETAHCLHELSDAHPAHVQMTLPLSWKRRRRKIPAGFLIYFADLPAEDITRVDDVPVTTRLRTLQDSLAGGVLAEFTESAIGALLAEGALSPSKADLLLRVVRGEASEGERHAIQASEVSSRLSASPRTDSHHRAASAHEAGRAPRAGATSPATAPL